jgi:hypothetical protein
MQGFGFFTKGNGVNEGASHLDWRYFWNPLAKDLRIRSWNILRSLRFLLLLIFNSLPIAVPTADSRLKVAKKNPCGFEPRTDWEGK